MERNGLVLVIFIHRKLVAIVQTKRKETKNRSLTKEKASHAIATNYNILTILTNLSVANAT